jgi:hypothetical protein
LVLVLVLVWLKVQLLHHRHKQITAVTAVTAAAMNGKAIAIENPVFGYASSLRQSTHQG